MPKRPTSSKRARKAKQPAADRCRVDGSRLRSLRQDAELSIRELAYAVDVDPKTITELEAGRRQWSQLRVVRSIAAHPDINVAWAELLVREPKAHAIQRPNTSSLDAYVEEERNGAALPPIGPLTNFGAKAFVNTFSSPASRAGTMHYVRGNVVAQRGLPPGDDRALGIDPHVGSRFLIARRVGSVEQPLTLTVITTTIGDTLAMQRAWEASTEIVAAVRVFVASIERPPSPAVADSWRGFVGLGAAQKPHPWTLVVTSILS